MVGRLELLTRASPADPGVAHTGKAALVERGRRGRPVARVQQLTMHDGHADEHREREQQPREGVEPADDEDETRGSRDEEPRVAVPGMRPFACR
jgi:hypothetical protein